MKHIEIGQIILNTFFNGRLLQELWEVCHCQMIWEAITKVDAQIISQSEVEDLLRKVDSVLVLPEPLPSMYMGIEPAFREISGKEILESGKCCDINDLFSIEPLYIVCLEDSWMIVLTTENTPAGDQLIALLKA